MERFCHINYVMLTRIRNKDIGFGKNKDQLKKEKKEKKKKRLSKEIRKEKIVIWNQIHH